MKKTNVLIFPAGSGCGPNIYQSLKYNLHFEAFGISMREDHTGFIFPKDRLRVSPAFQIADESFWPSFEQILSEWNIQYIIPTHDTIARYLMENQDKINAVVVCSPLETAEIAEDKFLTYERLKDRWYYPRVFNPNEPITFPVFLKPAVAAGAKGTVKADDQQSIDVAISDNPNLLICEYLPGEEYTVDCFTNSERELLFMGARTRERITQGVAFLSKRVELTPEIEAIAHDLNETFHFRGAWFFQVKENAAGELRLMEFSVRQAGTMAFYRQLGVNFTALSLFDFMGLPVKVVCNDLDLVLDRGTETLYDINYEYDTLYLDFDDTLIVNGKVNTAVVRLVYQSINRGVKVVLLTKHVGDLDASLAKNRLHASMFDEIILLEPNANKADHIKHNHAIFVDNYFPERMHVHKTCGIPVFDVDAVECLLDMRNI